MTASGHKGESPIRRRWAAIALATLLAFLGQSFVTQTHLHVDPVARAATLGAPGIAATLKAGHPAPVPPCPICREIAHAGSYLAPASTAVIASAPGAVWRVVLPPRALTPSQYSHAWRSRAPPRPLQA